MEPMAYRLVRSLVYKRGVGVRETVWVGRTNVWSAAHRKVVSCVIGEDSEIVAPRLVSAVGWRTLRQLGAKCCSSDICGTLILGLRSGCAWGRWGSFSFCRRLSVFKPAHRHSPSRAVHACARRAGGGDIHTLRTRLKGNIRARGRPF